MKQRMNEITREQLDDWEVQAAVNGRLDEWQAVALVEEIRELHSEIQQLQDELTTLRELQRVCRAGLHRDKWGTLIVAGGYDDAIGRLLEEGR